MRKSLLTPHPSPLGPLRIVLENFRLFCPRQSLRGRRSGRGADQTVPGTGIPGIFPLPFLRSPLFLRLSLSFVALCLLHHPTHLLRFFLRLKPLPPDLSSECHKSGSAARSDADAEGRGSTAVGARHGEEGTKHRKTGVRERASRERERERVCLLTPSFPSDPRGQLA